MLSKPRPSLDAEFFIVRTVGMSSQLLTPFSSAMSEQMTNEQRIDKSVLSGTLNACQCTIARSW